MSNLRLGYVNLVMLSGRLTADPELKYTQKGAPVCTFRIASTRRYKDRESSEKREETIFINVVTWRRQAELVNEYVKKGHAILIEGRLHSRSWETEEGQKRSIVEVVAYRVQFLERPDADVETAAPADVEGAAPADDESVKEEIQEGDSLEH